VKGHGGTLRAIHTKFPFGTPQEEVSKANTEVLSGCFAERINVTIAFGIGHNIVGVEQKIEKRGGLIDVVYENEEEEGSKDRSLRDTSHNVLPHRGNITRYNTEGTLLEE
jgi:hypothetical protein